MRRRDFRREVDVVVEDDVVGAGAARERGLLAGADGGDDARAGGLEHLGEEEADAAGSGVHERDVAGLRLAAAVDEVVRRHALQHRRAGDVVGDAGRDAARDDRRGR